MNSRKEALEDDSIGTPQPFQEENTYYKKNYICTFSLSFAQEFSDSMESIGRAYAIRPYSMKSIDLTLRISGF
jgi:hypothetical protein